MDTRRRTRPCQSSWRSPCTVWLGRPWKWRETRGPLASTALGGALAFALAGVLLDVTSLLAAAWCVALFVFLKLFATGYSLRLILLPFLGFPWIALDGQAIGWWFRFSGAAAAEGVFSTLGFHVQRQGTLLLVRDLPLSVEPGCAGMNVLQAMLVAGFALVYLKVPAGRRFWIALACLAPLAWLSNTLRIVMLGLTGLSMGAEFAMGWFHEFGGWIVLCLMFFLSLPLFRALAADETKRRRA